MGTLDAITILKLASDGKSYSHLVKRLNEKQKKFISEKAKELNIEINLEEKGEQYGNK